MNRSIRKTLAAGLSVAALATGSIAASPAEAANKPITLHKHEARQRTIDDHGERIQHKTNVWWTYNFRLNTPKSKHWIKPRTLMVSNDMLGRSRYSCGLWTPYDGTTYTLTITQPHTGQIRTFSVRTRCAGDTTANAVKGLTHLPRFYYTGGVSPRWKIEIHDHWGFGIPDNYSQVSGGFNLHAPGR